MLIIISVLFFFAQKKQKVHCIITTGFLFFGLLIIAVASALLDQLFIAVGATPESKTSSVDAGIIS
jgi:hypothetical protein